MLQDHASRTAQYMALFRAIESGRPAKRRLFNDPFARECLDKPLRVAASASRLPILGSLIPWILDTAWPGARSSGVARTRFIDDRLRQAILDGFRQVVILGAGFDSRAYRVAELASLRVIEVDHPATSRAKRILVEKWLGGSPSRVQSLPLDFDSQDLDVAIHDTDFEAAVPTVVIWEGVTNYLTPEGVDATFGSLQRISRRCRVVFTYIDKSVLRPDSPFRDTGNVRKRLGSVGERWTFGFDPLLLPEYLKKKGFRLLEDVGSREYRMLYLRSRKRLLRGYEFYRIAVADSVAA